MPATPEPLTISGHRFVDAQGREVHLRGVNLGGSSKTPPDEPTHIANTFSRHQEVSFIGRPFPRRTAREHYARLRHWGFNLLRFIVTWEAVEHAGRGQYDTAYLDYLTEMVQLAGEFGFYVFIDPHQDVWSRMTGGDGAPGWTLEGVGFDITRLDLSEAAFTMQRRYPDYPVMAWTDNNARLACMTMFALFFCGDRYAPGLHVDGLPVQEYLQGAFIGAMQQVAQRLKDMPHVLGYGPMNEPSKGLVGLPSLQDYVRPKQQVVTLNAAQAILAGSGIPQTVQTDDGPVTLNPHGISAWKERDIWRDLGVWTLDANGQPQIVRDDYFAGVDFVSEALLPFIKRYAAAMREISPNTIIFVEGDPKEPEKLRLDDTDLHPIVNASHWYDEYALFTRRFDGETAWDLETRQTMTGPEAVAETFKRNVGRVVSVSETQMGGVPTLIGEFGVAYDMNDGEALATGDFSLPQQALSMYYDALDANLVHAAQWNYTADNTNRWGDGWNDEDLSIFSLDQQTNRANIHSGGRAVRGFCRPRVMKVTGRLLRQEFNSQTAYFTAVVQVETPSDEPSIIYVPEVWYEGEYELKASAGTWRVSDSNMQYIEWVIDKPGEHTFRIIPAAPEFQKTGN